MSNTGAGMQGIALLGGLPAGLGALTNGYYGTGLITLCLAAGLFYLGRQTEDEVDAAREQTPPPVEPPLQTHRAPDIPDEPPLSVVQIGLQAIDNEWMLSNLDDEGRLTAMQRLGNSLYVFSPTHPVVSAADVLDPDTEAGAYLEALTWLDDYSDLAVALEEDAKIRHAFVALVQARVGVAAATGTPLGLFDAVDGAIEDLEEHDLI